MDCHHKDRQLSARCQEDRPLDAHEHESALNMEERFFEILEGGIGAIYRPSILCCLIEKVTPVVYPEYEKRAVIVNDSPLQDEILVAVRVSSYFEALSLCSSFDQSSSFADTISGSCDLYVCQLILLSWRVLSFNLVFSVLVIGEGSSRGAFCPLRGSLAGKSRGCPADLAAVMDSGHVSSPFMTGLYNSTIGKPRWILWFVVALLSSIMNIAT